MTVISDSFEVLTADELDILTSFVCDNQKFKFVNTFRNESTVHESVSFASCKVKVYQPDDKIEFLFTLSVGHSYGKIRGVKKVRQNDVENEEESHDFVLSVKEGMHLSLQATFDTILEGITVKHALYSSRESDHSLYSGFNFTTSEAWHDFLHSHNTSHLANSREYALGNETI